MLQYLISKENCRGYELKLFQSELQITIEENSPPKKTRWVKRCKNSTQGEFGNKNNGGMKANLIMNSEQLQSGIMAEIQDRTGDLFFVKLATPS